MKIEPIATPAPGSQVHEKIEAPDLFLITVSPTHATITLGKVGVTEDTLVSYRLDVVDGQLVANTVVKTY